MSYDPIKYILNIQHWQDIQQTYICVVITVSADGLALSGARPSAGKMMAKFKSLIYTYTYVYDRHLKRN